MSDSIPVEFIVNAEAMSQIEDEGFRWKPYGELISFIQWLDETLIESLTPDELIEFIGIDSEFLVYTNIR